MSRVDARLREMQFLAKLEREGKIEVTGAYDGSAERQMIVSLVYQEYVNGLDSVERHVQHPSGAMASAADAQFADLGQLLSVHKDTIVEIRMCHKGRVRLSELEQQLKTGRDRDPTGLCLAKRHLMTDLAVALLTADKEAPLSVVFLDMNGLKAVNDSHGHHAGDEAIRAYLEAVVVTFGEHGEAYRGEGGDEAVVVLPGAVDDRAGQLLDTFVRQLGKVSLVLGDGDAKVEVRLTASCGSATTTDPNEDAAALLKRADAVQYRAKAESKRQDPRASAWAVGDGDVVTYAVSAVQGSGT